MNANGDNDWVVNDKLQQSVCYLLFCVASVDCDCPNVFFPPYMLGFKVRENFVALVCKLESWNKFYVHTRDLSGDLRA